MCFPASVFLNHHFSTSSETVSLRVFSRAQLGFSIWTLRQTRPCLLWAPTLVYHLTSGTSFGLNLQDVHRLISSSVVTNVSSSLTSTAVFNRCPRLFVWTREFCFIFFLVRTVFVKSLTLLLKAQRCLFLWLVLVHWSNGASSGSAACIRWLLFFLRRDESLGWCHTSGLLP